MTQYDISMFLNYIKLGYVLKVYLQYFLPDKSFRVKVKNTLSERVFLEKGIVQGSPKIIFLILIAINEAGNT